MPTYGPVKLDLFIDFLNFGSWLSRSLFNYVEEINTSTTNGGQTRALGSATYTAAGLVRLWARRGTTNLTTAEEMGARSGSRCRAACG